ncbi:MAG: hypothetical protein ABIT37_18190 [Luteolibacter sp.]
MKPNPTQSSEAPIPGDARRKSSWSLVLKGFLVAIVVMLIAGLTAPMVLRCRKKADQTEAVNNVRQIGLALFEFQQAYGSFPDALTAAVVREDTGTHLKLGTKFSNDFFRQLLAGELAQSEAMFYAKGEGVRKPDNRSEGTDALKKGECGFTYLLGASLTSDAKRPLLVTPMIPGTDRFDPKPLEGKAVILRMDNTVTSYPINKDGHIVVDGKNLMDPRHPVWEGHAPVIAWPDL